MSQPLEKYSSTKLFPRKGILVFDSGVGGLSIAYEIQKLLPDVPLLSLGDHKYFPYGQKSEEFLLNRILEILDYSIKEFEPSLVVVACNTASTFILPHLREKYDIPFVGVVPPVKPAGEYSKTRSIAVLSTEATSSRPYLDDLINEFASDCHVEKFGSKTLAILAERRISGDFVTIKDVERSLKPFDKKSSLSSLDSLVLGCTHYSIFKAELQNIFGNHVKIFDPSMAVATQVSKVFRTTFSYKEKVSWFLTSQIDKAISKEKYKNFGIENIYYMQS